MSTALHIDEIVAENHNNLLYAPPAWKRIRLADIATIQNGFPFESRRFSKISGTPLLRIRDILRGQTETFYTGDWDQNFLIEADDLLVGMDGEFHCALWRGPRALLNQRVCRIVPNEARCSKRYLAYVLPGYLSAINAHTPSITVKHLSSRTIAQIPVPLPPLKVQRRIVETLDAQFSRLEAGIEALTRIRRSLNLYRAAVLTHAVEGRLVSMDQDAPRESAAKLLDRLLEAHRAQWPKSRKYKEPWNPGTGLPALPKGWVWATIDQLAAPEAYSITDGPFGSNLKTAHYRSDGPRVIRLQNIGNGTFNDEKAHISSSHFAALQKHRVLPGDVLIAALGEVLPRACLAPMDLGPAIVKADCIRFKPSVDVNAQYLKLALNSEPVRNRTKRLVHGVGRPRLNLAAIRSIEVPLPPADEQARIVAEVDRRLSVADDLERIAEANIRRATNLRKAILQDAFSGKRS